MDKSKNTLWDKVAFIAQMTLLISTAIVTVDQIRQMNKRNNLLSQSNNEKA